VCISVRAADPVWMLTGPIPATTHALRKTGLAIDHIDPFEVNEAFASVVLAWIEETGADRERVKSTAAASRSATLSARGARSSSPRCCTN
jgi:acetyl-CoA acetyltransferase